MRRLIQWFFLETGLGDRLLGGLEWLTGLALDWSEGGPVWVGQPELAAVRVELDSPESQA